MSDKGQQMPKSSEPARAQDSRTEAKKAGKASREITLTQGADDPKAGFTPEELSAFAADCVKLQKENPGARITLTVKTKGLRYRLVRITATVAQ